MNKYNKVLVTGGSGFIGQSIMKIRPEWVYMSSSDCDITDKDKLYDYLKCIKPDAIIHLAARVGGIKDSVTNQADFLYLNNLINTNIVHQAYKAGIGRMLSCLSTCCFPDINDLYPMTEEDLLKGEPTQSNYGYAYAKRILFLQSKYYSECYGLNYNTFTPSNIYGENNSFDNDNSHFVSRMIRAFSEAKDGEELTFWGSGQPLRQHLYVKDLAEIIVMLLDKHNTKIPLIVSPNENLSIKEHINTMNAIAKKNNVIKFNGDLDGQFRKDASNKNLLELIGGYNFTNLKAGLGMTYNWYQKNQFIKITDKF